MQNKHLTIFANLSVLMALIFTTIMTTSSELWSEQLVYVQAIIIIGGVAAAIAMVFSTEKPRLTAADTTMVLWWTYVMMRTYLDIDNTMAFRNIIVYTTLTATYTVIRLMPKQHVPVDKIMVMLLLAALCMSRHLVCGRHAAAQATTGYISPRAACLTPVHTLPTWHWV